MIWWKWLLVAAAVPVGLGLIVVAVGAMLPVEHLARARASLAAPPERVAALVRDVEAQPRWRGGVTAIEILERSPDGIRYVERQGSDAITFTFREERPGALFRSTIADPDLPFGGFWIIALEPAGSGTTIRIEEHGSVTNPLFRFVSRFILGHEATMKAYLADLERAAAS
jgi:hypothetical protein